MDPSEAAPFEPFAYVFLKPAPTTSASSSPTGAKSRSRPRQSPKRSTTRSDASGKRKRDDGSMVSSITTDFAAATREKTKALLYGQCFHCEMKPGPYSPTDVCRVIPKKSPSYSRHLADGPLDFSLDDIANSVLCKNCHTVFDDLEPGCTFLPTDLEFFIQFEEEDLKRRQAIVDERQQEYEQLHNARHFLLFLPPRHCPTAREYLEAWIAKEPMWPSSAVGGAYTRFTMPEYKQRPDVMRPQAWHGAPLAAILHAFRAILGNVTPLEFVAPSIERQLRKLQKLYERHPETGPGGNTSVNLGELGSNMPSLPPPQSSSSMHDPSARQVMMQAHAAENGPTESSHALVATESSTEQPSKKRHRNFSSRFQPQHEPQRRSPPPRTPAFTCKASTISHLASPGLQPHLLVDHKNSGGVGEETREDSFSYDFRYDWKWGPQSSTQEKVERFLGLSQEEDTDLLK